MVHRCLKIVDLREARRSVRKSITQNATDSGALVSLNHWNVSYSVTSCRPKTQNPKLFKNPAKRAPGDGKGEQAYGVWGLTLLPKPPKPTPAVSGPR